MSRRVKERSDALKKETILEAKDEVHKLRAEAERETRERRNELQRLERRLQQKEESLDRKLEAVLAGLLISIVVAGEPLPQ